MGENGQCRLSQVARTAWGKSSRDGTEEWLPLWRHMSDTGSVAERLWDEWLPDNVKALISASLPEGAADGRILCRWLAFIHDIGKATPAFAFQVDRLAARMRDHGYVFNPLVPDDYRIARHALAGMVLLDGWLEQRYGLERLDSQQLSIVVGGHHGMPPEDRDLHEARKRTYLLGLDETSGSVWREVQAELLDWAAAETGAADRLPDWGELLLPQPVQAVLTGIVITADWIASNEALFPYDAPDTVPPHQRLERAWKELDLPTPWRAEEPDNAESRFFERFDLPENAAIRPVQAAAMELARTMSAPGIMIVEAPMGEGKTEAALAAAEILASRTGNGGCLVALPTRATSDAMFKRVLDWLTRLPDADVGRGHQSVVLAHGKARLNEEFQQLFRRGMPSRIGIDEGGAGVAAHRWTRGRKLAMLSNFAIGTVDQFLFSALKSKHLVLRHLGLAGKVVIIDEAHAYDVFMSSFLDKALEWMGALGVPIIVLSATLPSERRKDMLAAYDGGRLGRQPNPQAATLTGLDGDIGYPVLTATGDDRVLKTVTEPSGRGQHIRLERFCDDDDELAARLEHALAEGGCALVIRNTVRRVQQTASVLRDRFPADTVSVAHSRFMAADRAAKDAWLRDAFGPPDRESPIARPAKHIVVASQVAEQSLDIDFDLLVTDLAPIDLLLQRMGRLHRHDRPERTGPAKCLITGADWSAAPPEPVRGSRIVYGRHALLRSAAALWDRLETGTGISLPDDIAPLVQAAYGDQRLGPEAWQPDMADAQAQHQAAMNSKAKRAKDFQLRSPGAAGDPLLGWLYAGAAGSDREDEDSPRGRAHVRDDSAETLEVLMVVRDGDRLITPPWLEDGSGGLTIPTEVEPPHPVPRIVASCSLALPRTIPVDAAIEELERRCFFPAWQDNHLLEGELLLDFDHDLRTELAGFQLRYDPDNGLEVWK